MTDFDPVKDARGPDTWYSVSWECSDASCPIGEHWDLLSVPDGAGPGAIVNALHTEGCSKVVLRPVPVGNLKDSQ